MIQLFHREVSIESLRVGADGEMQDWICVLTLGTRTIKRTIVDSRSLLNTDVRVHLRAGR